MIIIIIIIIIVIIIITIIIIIIICASWMANFALPLRPLDRLLVCIPNSIHIYRA